VTAFFPKQDTSTDKLLKMMAKRGMPLSFVEDEDTREWIRSYDKNATLPDRKTLLQRFERKASDHALVVAEIIKGQHVACTTDGWTSLGGDTFTGMTMQFINDDWEMVVMPLWCVKSHGGTSGPEVKEKFLKILGDNSVELEQVVAIVTDCEPAMCAAGRLLPFPHHGCTAHRAESTTGLFFNGASKKFGKAAEAVGNRKFTGCFVG
jgi:hypothetical protein